MVSMTTKGFRTAGNFPTLIAALVHFDVSFMVWGDPNADPHVVETTAGRLRTRLGPAGRGLVSVPRRGYRIAHEITLS